MTFIKTDEDLAIQIREVLVKCCPAFNYTPSSTAEWHGCDCNATGGSCVCVWVLTPRCPVGKWPQLDFVNEINTDSQIKRLEMFNKAKQAIAESEVNK